MLRASVLSFLIVVSFAVAAEENGWTGKPIFIHSDTKLGHKQDGKLVPDGAALEKGKTFIVKSDDGTYLELEGQTGFLLKSDAVIAATWDLPRKGEPARKATNPNCWAANTEVFPRKRPGNTPFGDRDADGKVTFFKLSGILPLIVLIDNGDGFVRIHDRSREGWVKKEDLFSKEDSIEFLNQAVKDNSKDDWALHLRAIVWRQKGNHENAIKDYTELIQRVPSNPFLWRNRADVWSMMKEYDKAIEDYTEAIRLDPKDVEAYLNRGTAWNGKQDFDRAIKDYTEAIRLNPKDPNTYLNRGVVCCGKRDFDQAIKDFTEAIRLDPTLARVYLNRGNAWKELQEYDRAIKDYTDAIRLEPTNNGSNRSPLCRE